MLQDKIQKYIPDNAQVEFCDNAGTFEVTSSEIAKVVNDLYDNKNLSLKLITATDERAEGGGFKIWYVFGLPKENLFIVPFIRLINTTEFPSLSTQVDGGAQGVTEIAPGTPSISVITPAESGIW